MDSPASPSAMGTVTWVQDTVMQVSHHRDKVGPRHGDVHAMGTARWVQDIGVRMSCDMGTKVGTGHEYGGAPLWEQSECRVQALMPLMETSHRQEHPGDTDGKVGERLGDRNTLRCQWQGRCRVTRMGLLTVTSQVR